MSQVIALVDDDRNILTSVSIALQQEGFVTRVYSDPRDRAQGARRQSARPWRVRHQDAGHGRDGAASPGARVQLDAGDLPDLEGRRARRGAGPGDGRRRLYLQALLAAAADRPHPRDPAAPGAGSAAKPPANSDEARAAAARARPPGHGPGAAQGAVGRQGRHPDGHRVPDPRSAGAAAGRRQNPQSAARRRL